MEKYFVVSNGEAPHQIFFSMEDATASKERYIDIFNEDGIHLTAFKKLEESEHYTDDF